MSSVDEILDEVRAVIEPNKPPLDEARKRLQLVRDAAESFPGALRTYRSGSLAVHTMNKPVTDGDGGLVLNRRDYPELGHDGGGESPDAVVDQLCRHLDATIRKIYPRVEIRKSKRGPELHFNAPVENQDPTVDLVLALNRKDADGLWIPNLKTHEWDASHPEKHVELLNGDGESFRSIRRRVIRLAKAWNKQFQKPGTSSFELSVWAWEFLDAGTGVAEGLHTLFDAAASRLEGGEPTHDPAGVSVDLRLLLEAEVVADRLRKAANAMAEALDASTDRERRRALTKIFWDHLKDESVTPLRNSANLLRTGAATAAVALGVAVAGSTTAAARSFGALRA